MTGSNRKIRQWKRRLHTIKRKSEGVFHEAMGAQMGDDFTDQLDALNATIENTISMIDRTLATHGGSNERHGNR